MLLCHIGLLVFCQLHMTVLYNNIKTPKRHRLRLKVCTAVLL